MNLDDKWTIQRSNPHSCLLTLVMDTHDFMEILKHLVQEKKDLQKRLDTMEEILHSYIPVIEKDERQ